MEWFNDVFGGFVEVSTDDTPPEDWELEDAEEIGFRDVVEYEDGNALVYWSPEEEACIARYEQNVLYFSSRHMVVEYSDLLDLIKIRTGCCYGLAG